MRSLEVFGDRPIERAVKFQACLMPGYPTNGGWNTLHGLKADHNSLFNIEDGGFRQDAAALGRNVVQHYIAGQAGERTATCPDDDWQAFRPPNDWW